jgi:hypothetical protein
MAVRKHLEMLLVWVELVQLHHLAAAAADTGVVGLPDDLLNLIELPKVAIPVAAVALATQHQR